MELMPYIPGAKEAILMHTFPGKNPNHRKLFLNAARDPDIPEILHAIGIRDLPTKIRFAVKIQAPSAGQLKKWQDNQLMKFYIT